MTSKNLFFKRLKQDLEQRVWLPVIFFIIGFLAMEIIMISEMSYYRDADYYVEWAMNYLLNSFFGMENFCTFITIGMAIISAISGFFYMHSAKKLDVYHSIPIKRQTMFLQQYVYGILYYLIPMLIHVVICIAICMANGIFGATVLKQAIGFVMVQLLVYMACYAVSVVAICITGNMIVNILGTAVLLCYSGLLLLLMAELMEWFFVTYHSQYSYPDFVAFSPIHLVLNMMEEMTNRAEEYLNYANYIEYYVKFLFMIAIYTAAGLFAYVKRPTEAAGKAMVFPITEPIVKTMVVFPASIISGYSFVGIIMSDNEIGWYIFGCIFGFVIFCPLMEIIFRRDVKALFSHPLQLVFNGILVIISIFILQFDLLSYDSYIPKEGKVESYAISFNATDQVARPMLENAEAYRFNNMTITDNESTRKLLEHAAQFTRPVMTGKIPVSLENNPCRTITVKYNLKNGKAVYRSLLIDVSDEQVVQWLKDTYDNVEYKEAAYPVLAYTESEEKKYVGLMLDYAYASEKIFLADEKMQKFIETYQKELNNLSFDEILTQIPVVRMGLAVVSSKEDNKYAATMEKEVYLDKYDYEEAYYKIYPSFTETLALLEEYGANIVNDIPAEDVTRIEIEDSSREVNDHDGLLTKLVRLEYTAEEGPSQEIAQILPNIVPSHFDLGFMVENRTEPYITVRVYYNQDGAQESGHFRFLVGKVPESVLEDIEARVQ